MTENTNPDVTAESPVEGTETSGVVEGTEVVSQEAYDALKAQFNAYRANLLATSVRYTDRHGWCREVGKALKEIDPVLKGATYSGTAEVTLKLHVEINESKSEVTDDQLWTAIGNLGYELGSCRGVVVQIPSTFGTVEIVDPFTVARTGLTGLAEYMTPEAFQAHEKAQEKARDLANQERGAYGKCVECGKNVDRSYDCTNDECDTFGSTSSDIDG